MARAAVVVERDSVDEFGQPMKRLWTQARDLLAVWLTRSATLRPLVHVVALPEPSVNEDALHGERDSLGRDRNFSCGTQAVVEPQQLQASPYAVPLDIHFKRSQVRYHPCPPLEPAFSMEAGFALPQVVILSLGKTRTRRGHPRLAGTAVPERGMRTGRSLCCAPRMGIAGSIGVKVSSLQPEPMAVG